MIQFLKTKDFPVKDPKRNVGEDAGFDFYIPDYSEEFIDVFNKENENNKLVEFVSEGDKHFIRIMPHGDVRINSGIYTRFSPNIALVAQNKSGIASKKKLIVGACVIDSAFENTVSCHLINTSDKPVDIEFGTKITQFVPFFIDISGYTVESENDVSHDEFYRGHNSQRGMGGFGSTGLK